MLVLQKIFVRQLIIACRFSRHKLKICCLTIQLAGNKVIVAPDFKLVLALLLFLELPPPSAGGKILMHEK